MKRLAIVGMPNTGKSTFFNRLTGSSSRVGNWPGVTVDLLSARIVLGGKAVEVVAIVSNESPASKRAGGSPIFAMTTA